MPNDYIPRPDARFHAWENNFATYVNRHLADLRLATDVIGADIRGRVARDQRREGDTDGGEVPAA